MSYKAGLDKFKEIELENIKNGKETILVFGKDGIFYEVKEHLGYVENIEEGNTESPSILTLLFSNGKTINTGAYTNGEIKKGDIVSVVGYFVQAYLGMEFYCKGGINKVITRATEVPVFNIPKIYRMGLFLGLSEIEASKTYTKNDNPIPLGKTNFSYIIKDVEREIRPELDENSVDTRFGQRINTSLYNETIEDDYQDID